MANKKIIDIPKEIGQIWQEAKQNLKALGQRTLKLAQKGEKEVVRASKIGKLQLDIVGFNLNKENVFRKIGKKAYDMHSKNGQVKSARLASMFTLIGKINQQIKAKKVKIAKLNKG